MWSNNRLVRELGVKYPIIQGPFGGGFSSAKLAATVSNCGGLGSFGAHHLSPKDITSKIEEIKSLTTKPFAINLWVSNADQEIHTLTRERYEHVSSAYSESYLKLGIRPPVFTEKFGEDFEEQALAVIKSKPSAFSFVFGIPGQHILELCRKNRIVTIGAATALDEAMAIENAGVDLVVLSGLEAGGHRPSFLKSSEESLTGLSALLPVVAEKIRIPIIAAGGIVTAKQIISAKVLGAEGFQIGTAFLACEESGASSIHKDIIFSERSRYTTLSRHYTGRLARFIDNDFLSRARKTNTPYLPYPAQNYLLAEMKRLSAERNLPELSPLYAGQGAPLVKYKNAKKYFESLIHEVEVTSKNKE